MAILVGQPHCGHHPPNRLQRRPKSRLHEFNANSMRVPSGSNRFNWRLRLMPVLISSDRVYALRAGTFLKVGKVGAPPSIPDLSLGISTDREHRSHKGGRGFHRRS